jgi:hypothetical protein
MAIIMPLLFETLKTLAPQQYNPKISFQIKSNYSSLKSPVLINIEAIEVDRLVI